MLNPPGSPVVDPSLFGVSHFRAQVDAFVREARGTSLSDDPLPEEAMRDMAEIPPRRGPRDYWAVLLFGSRGKGKTLFLSALARVFREHYRAAGVRRRVFTNYWNEDADICDPFILDALVDPRYQHLVSDGILLLDEIQSAATGRRAMSRVNVGIAYYLTQIRKQHLDVVFTTQRPQYIDQQVLTQVNLFVETRLTFTRGAPPELTAYVHDYFGEIVSDHLYHQRRGMPRPWEADWVRTVRGIEAVFGRYDTDEVIVPMYLPPDLRRRVVLDEWERKGHTGKLLRPYAELEGIDATEVLAYLPGAQEPDPEPPADLGEAIDRYTATRDQFNVTMLVRHLSSLPDPPSRVDVLAYLAGQGGWTITKRGAQAFATREVA